MNINEKKSQGIEKYEDLIWEGKGIVDNLFHLLWKKDPILDSSNTITKIFLINIFILLFWSKKLIQKKKF